MLPGPPAQPPSAQGRTTNAPRRLVPRWSGPWAAESEPRTGSPRSAPDALMPAALGLPGWAGFPPRAGAPVGVFREVLRGAFGVLDRRRRQLTQVSEGPHPPSLPNPAAHNPATHVTASQSSARHQGAEQRKRGREARTATDTGRALPGRTTKSRPGTRQHRLAKAEPEEKVRPPGRRSAVRAPGTHAEHAAIRRCVAGLRQQPMIVC